MERIIAAYNFCNQDFDGFVAGAAEAGFPHVGIGFYKGYLDIPLEHLTAEEEKLVRDKLEDGGLQLCAIYGGVSLLADDGLDLLKRKLDGAARFEVSILDTGAIALDEDSEKRSKDIATFIERIRQAGDHADRLGITICLETHGGYTGDADSCLEAMSAISHERVRLAYDPANFLYYEGRRPEERLEELLPFIGHTHLKDHRGGKGNNDFPAIGQGEVGYERLLPALWEGGYRGPYTLERAVGESNEEKAAAMKAAREYMEGLIG